MKNLVVKEYNGITINTKSGHVYVLLASDGSIKIGMSKNVPGRIKDIESTTKKTIVTYYVSEYIDDSLALESYMHMIFKNHRTKGEWFDVDFHTACYQLYSLQIEKPWLSECHRSKTMQKAVNAIVDLSCQNILFKELCNSSYCHRYCDSCITDSDFDLDVEDYQEMLENLLDIKKNIVGNDLYGNKVCADVHSKIATGIVGVCEGISVSNNVTLCNSKIKGGIINE